MFQAHLTTDQLWRGQLYLAGDRSIPDDLAIALNLAQPKSATPPTSVAETTEMQTDPALQPINPAPPSAGKTTTKAKSRQTTREVQ